jgi:predicted enzyme related to lactoylglutathione lyase
MTEIDRYEPGTFSWVDVQTTDPEAGKRFYTQLFGWEAEDMPAGGAGVYTMFSLRGRYVSALSEMSGEQFEGVPPHWNSYVTVDDVDERAKAAVELGGKLLMDPFDVLDSGRMAVLQDPVGAVVMLWEPRRHIGAQLIQEPGTLAWNELLTRDTDTAARFYTQLFGWRTEEMDIEGGPPYTVFQRGDQPAGGLFEIREDMGDVPPNWSVCFAVADADATVARTEELVGSVVTPPMDIPTVGRFAVLADPQGAVFTVMQSALPPSGN